MVNHLVKLALSLLLSVFVASSASAASVNWVDWTSASSSSARGTLNLGSTVIETNLSGRILDFVNGDYYYNNSYTKLNGTYGTYNPTDLIRISTSGTYEINFSSPVLNPYISLVSVGASSNPVTYQFDSPFQVLTYGRNYWGYVSYNVTGNSLKGTEYNGIIQLNGTFDKIAFTVDKPESWHGFNVGAVPAPEPSSILFGFLSLTGILGFKRRKY
jgi:hypothetical protein